MNTLAKAASVSVIALSTLAPRAQLLFEQDPIENHQGFRLHQFQLEGADSFQLPTSSSIGFIQWWGTGPQDAAGDFTVRIYNESGGLPGSPVFEVSAGPGSPNLTPLMFWTGGGVPIYSYSTVLATPFQAAANERYWISISNQRDPTWAWVWASGALERGQMIRRSETGNWDQPYGNDLAFALHVVPEPATTTLIALSAATVFLLRCRN